MVDGLSTKSLQIVNYVDKPKYLDRLLGILKSVPWCYEHDSSGAKYNCPMEIEFTFPIKCIKSVKKKSNNSNFLILNLECSAEEYLRYKDKDPINFQLEIELENFRDANYLNFLINHVL